jgi:predicted nucleic acid-binding protein
MNEPKPFELAEQGQMVIVIPEVVIVEIAHVLRSIYKQTAKDIAEGLKRLSYMDSVYTHTLKHVLRASLENFALTVPWLVALIAAWAAEENSPEIYTFDDLFDRFRNIKKITH